MAANYQIGYKMPFKIGDEVYFECTVDSIFKGEGVVYLVDKNHIEWPYTVKFSSPIRGMSIRNFSEKELDFVNDDSRLSDWI
jgi:hypothetical protein